MKTSMVLPMGRQQRKQQRRTTSNMGAFKMMSHGDLGEGGARRGRMIAAFVVGALVLGSAVVARAGRGGSPQAIASAVASGSADAIKAELERAEYLVCAACVPYVLPLIDNDDAGIRQVAAWWLARRGTSRQVFRDMLTRLGQPDSVKARNAADVLGEFSNPQAIAALGAALSNPLFDPPARAAMARALGAIRRPAAALPLRNALGDGEPVVRAAALSALRQVQVQGGDFRDAAVATPLLGDSDQEVRVQAIFTVAALRTTTAAAGLVQLLRNDPSAAVRKRAAWALGEIHAPVAVAAGALGEAASTDSSPVVRSLATAALGNLSP
ncbi:MAG: HEAT repeat domain-containing protein [Polyangia bacterium]